jgi:hypothetical protein
MAAGEVDDRQPSMAEYCARGLMNAVVVGPSVSESLEHLSMPFSDARYIPDRACYAAHSFAPVL